MAFNKEIKNTASDFKAKLKLNPGGIYFLYGDEEYLKDSYVGEIKKLVDPGVLDLNYTKICAEGVDKETFQKITDYVTTPPMMSEWRVVVVRGLEVLKLNADNEYLMTDLVNSVGDDIILVFSCRPDEYLIDSKTRNSRIVKFLQENSFYIECSHQNEMRLLPWIDRHFAICKLRISDVNSRMLINLCKNDMMLLQNETDKLAAYCVSQNAEEVTREMIESLVADSAEYDIYELGNLIISSSKSKTLKTYYSLKRQQSEPIVIVASISRAISGSMMLESAIGARATAERIEKATGMKDWQQRKVYRNKIPQKIYLQALEMCLECDRKLKSTKNDEDVLCERLITDLLELFAMKEK